MIPYIFLKEKFNLYIHPLDNISQKKKNLKFNQYQKRFTMSWRIKIWNKNSIFWYIFLFYEWEDMYVTYKVTRPRFKQSLEIPRNNLKGFFYTCNIHCYNKNKGGSIKHKDSDIIIIWKNIFFLYSNTISSNTDHLHIMIAVWWMVRYYLLSLCVLVTTIAVIITWMSCIFRSAKNQFSYSKLFNGIP